MIRHIFAAIFFASLCGLAEGRVIFTGKDTISVKSDIPSWVRSIKRSAQEEIANFHNDADGFTECRETLELPNTYLCGTYLQRDMNSLLGRATIFSDGFREYNKGSLVSLQDRRLQSLKDVMTGHDLPGNELFSFYHAARMKCAAGLSAFCLSDAENEFFKQMVIPASRRNKPFVIIAFSVQSTTVPQFTISHEMLHARFLLDAKYHDQVKSFWDTKMSADEHDQIESELKRFGYNNQDKDTMMNEFQAYILQDGADNNRLAQYIDQFRIPLYTYLN
jgi:hypothetical protein